jgi:O-antigen/teichoic acid export membrane protein
MNSIKQSTIWNLIGNILPLLIGLLCIPFLVKNIGIERFGVLTLIWTLIGYFSIFDFGIGRALTYSVSIQKTENDNNKLYSSIYSGLKLVLITGLIGGFILALISKQLGYSWLNTNINLREETYYSILIASLAIPFTTYTSGIKGVLEGFEEFKQINILKLILGLLNFISPVFCVFLLGNSLINIVILLVIIRIAILILHLIYLNKKIKLTNILFRSKFIASHDNKLLKFGAWMTLSNLVSPLMVNADRFFISYVLGASMVAYYTIPFDLVIRILIIPASLTSVLFPRFSKLINNDIYEANKIYQKSTSIVLKIMFIITLVVISLSYLGLKLWINEDVATKSYLLLIILMLGVFFNGLAQVPFSLIQAAGKVKDTSILHIIEFGLYIILLVTLIKFFGLIGVAFAFLLRTFIDFFILGKIANKILNNTKH